MENIQNLFQINKLRGNTDQSSHNSNTTAKSSQPAAVQKMPSNVRGIENEYEDNPDDTLEIVPENKQQQAFIPGYRPQGGRISSVLSADTEPVSNVSLNGHGHGYGSSASSVPGVIRNNGMLIPPSSGMSNGFKNIQHNHNSNPTNGETMSTSTSGSKKTMVMTGQLDDTSHYIKGKGILASKKDMQVDPDEFAAGCKLLQACALGNLSDIQELLRLRPHHINFRDYDRRTALHVAASEGKMDIVKALIVKYNAAINRSDRWGGSPLDDACRHRHSEVISYLRSRGASTGSTDLTANVITAAAAGDIDDLEVLLNGVDLSRSGNNKSTSSKAISPLKKNTKVDINGKDYDGRTALHLSSAAGHVKVVRFLISKGSNVNAVDNWGGKPLDDAIRMSRVAVIRVLQSHGATTGKGKHFEESSGRGGKQKEDKNLQVEFSELDVIDKIGSGAFGEIFKCKWRGTLVAAKCIKSTKIVEIFREDNLPSANSGDEMGMTSEEVNDALSDFREETAILRTLRVSCLDFV